MSKKPTYRDYLKAEFTEQIDGLDVLTEAQRGRLKSRMLEQILWLEGATAKAQRKYYVLRVTTVVGAVIVPALISLTTLSGEVGHAARIAAWILSLVVAVSTAVEQFFHYGDRWRNYRRTVEYLKSEAWRYFQGGGRWGAGPSATYTQFTDAVEDILRSDVDTYLTKIVSNPGEKTHSAPS